MIILLKENDNMIQLFFPLVFYLFIDMILINVSLSFYFKKLMIHIKSDN